MTPEQRALTSQVLAAAARAHHDQARTGENKGAVECPRCKGRVTWVRAPSNGHISGACQTKGCKVVWIQ